MIAKTCLPGLCLARLVALSAADTLPLVEIKPGWGCRLFDAAGNVTAESRWKGKNLLDANVNGRLP